MTQKLESFLSKFLNHQIKFIPRNSNQISKFEHNIPEDWKALQSTNTPLLKIVKQIWLPIRKYNRKIPHYFSKRTLDIHFMIDVHNFDLLGMLYTIYNKDRDTNRYWVGGLPVEKNEIRKFNQETSYEIPTSIHGLYKIHNGFEVDGLSGWGFRKLQNLFFLSEFDIWEEVDSDYDPSKLMAFWGDGVGNYQCFNFDSSTKHGDFLTCDWDHETRQLGNLETLWDFFERVVIR